MHRLSHLVPPPLRSLRWRLPWLRSTPAFRDAPATTLWRAACFTAVELGRREFTLAAPDGIRLRTMANNFSSFAYCVAGARDPAVWAFICRRVPAGGVFVDCGANVGTYTLPAARLVGASGRVIAVEAHPHTFRYLLHNIADNGLANILALNTALGETAGLVDLHYTDTNPGETHIAAAGETGDTARIPLRPLDEVLDEAGIVRVDYLKIDVEGFELPVLRGARRVLAANHGMAVQTELYDHHAARYGHRIDDLVALMTGNGFCPWFVQPDGTLRPVDGRVRGEIVWARA